MPPSSPQSKNQSTVSRTDSSRLRRVFNSTSNAIDKIYSTTRTKNIEPQITIITELLTPSIVKVIERYSIKNDDSYTNTKYTNTVLVSGLFEF